MNGTGNYTGTSAFNEGMNQIQRLNEYWIQANYASRTADFNKWRWILDVIWRELSRDAIRLQEKKLDPKDFRNLSEKNEWFRNWNSLCKEWVLITKLPPSHQKGAQYQVLNTMEIFLRALQDRAGKGGKYKESDDNMD